MTRYGAILCSPAGILHNREVGETSEPTVPRPTYYIYIYIYTASTIVAVVVTAILVGVLTTTATIT